tara:strand:+ start:289 stop:579 length:291 start_codon:yes stop_codon:yes gene_type:complete
MDSEENKMEKESLDFLANCTVNDFVTLYEHMTLCKLEELQDDTLELKYKITESEGDPDERGTIISFDKMVQGVEAVFGMTDDDLKYLHEKICKIRK